MAFAAIRSKVLFMFIQLLLLLPLRVGGGWGCAGSLFCGVGLYVRSSSAIILVTKRELIALLK